MLAISSRECTNELRGPLTSRSAIEAQLQKDFEAASIDEPCTLDRLHVSAVQYTYSLRNEGLRPEQVVIALKSLLCCHGGYSSMPSLVGTEAGEAASAGNAVYSLMLNWCMEAYFEHALDPI